jgi:hypothetical protein
VLGGLVSRWFVYFQSPVQLKLDGRSAADPSVQSPSLM